MVVSVNGAELFYSTRGTGIPCIVPCILGTKPYETLTPPPLTDFFQFIYVDLRGGGKSTGNPADLTFDVLASDLEAVRAHLGVERVAVLGYSIVGVLAIEYRQALPAKRLSRHRGRNASDRRHAADGEGGSGFFEADGSRGAEGDPERELREASAGHSA